MNEPVKTCPSCYLDNQKDASFCARCTCDILAVEPGVPSAGAQVAPASAPPSSEISGTAAANVAASGDTLEMVVGNQSHECRDGDIIGRAGTIACHLFEGLLTVSGEHIKVLKKDGRWCIIILGQNMTQMDGRPLTRGQSEFLTGEHRLQLSRQCEIILRVSTTRS